MTPEMAVEEWAPTKTDHVLTKQSQKTKPHCTNKGSLLQQQVMSIQNCQGKYSVDGCYIDNVVHIDLLVFIRIRK